MTFENRHIGTGLLPLEKDDRDFSMGALLGEPLWIPNEEFVVAMPLKVKDQNSSDLCTAYAACAVSEDQECVELSPEHFFAQEKKMQGQWETWGADLRTACKTATKIGFIEQAQAPFTLARDGRDKVANWNNWPPTLDQFAIKHAKQAYFTVDGIYDTFDNIRATLWAYKHEKRSILTGALWKDSWTEAAGGIIPLVDGQGQNGHAFKLFGQKFIAGAWYLMAQLSNGASIGNQGIFYFPREVVNKEFVYGNYFFKDLPEEFTKEKAQEKSCLYRRGVFGRISFYFNKYIEEILR